MDKRNCEEKSAGTADCCAVLLRGGKSRRMGTDKALLPWKDGRTFLQAVAEQMDIFPEKYLSVSADYNGSESGSVSHEAGCFIEQSLSPDWVLLPDRIADCGPMGGIWTALSACRAQWALVASCDIPAVQRELFYMLLKEREAGDYDMIFPVTPEGRIHFTCALYKKTAAPVLEEQIRQGDYRLRSLLPLCSSRAAAVEEPSMVRMLSNVNTKEDLRQLEQGGGSVFHPVFTPPADGFWTEEPSPVPYEEN